MKAMKFSKYTGLGNNFILVDQTCFSECISGSDISAAARKLCDPKFGIGADGLIIVSESPLFMDIYNADGSRSSMCGNGIRCMAEYLFDSGKLPCDTVEYTIDTPSGTKHIRALGPVNNNGEFLVEVGMGIPEFSAKSIYIDEDGDFRRRSFDILDTKIILTAVSTGCAHAIVWLDENPVTDAKSPMELYNDENIKLYGPALCTHPVFTQGANIDFARVTGKNEISMITWERGSGLTAACGTGAAAAAIVGVEEKGLGSDVTVHLPYGKLSIRIADTGEVFMTGPARRVFTGEIEF